MNKNYFELEILEDEIVSIEEYEIIDTIDIEIDSKNRLFFANDILTHNSGWEANDLSITSVAESAGLLHTVDILFGIITNAEMKARGEYYLKCLANRVGGNENMRKRYEITWPYARIEEDRNSQIEDMDFFINQVTAGARHPRAHKSTPNVINVSDAISESSSPETPKEPDINKDIINTKISGSGLF